MRPEVVHVSRGDVADLISPGGEFNLSKDESLAFRVCLRSTASVWLGRINGEWACIWGIVLPTLSDDRPYLWLHVTDKIKGHEFGFIRQSQIHVRDLLETYPAISGHCRIDAEQSIRWIKLVGGTFGESIGDFVSFTIARKNGKPD